MSRLTVISCALCLAVWTVRGGVVDSIRFGDAASESAHGFDGPATEVVTGGLGEPARRILKLAGRTWRSEPMAFTLRLNPSGTNYLTVKFWGGDVTHDHLLLFLDGKHLGYMHLGDYDILDYEQCWPRDAPPDQHPDPQYQGRFTYKTFYLPPHALAGKSSVRMEIRACGKIWGYGQTFGQFQHEVTQPSRGIYAATVHDRPFLPPDPAELSRLPAVPPPAWTEAPVPSPDFGALKRRVNAYLLKALDTHPGADDGRLALVAHAWHVSWCAGYRNPKAAAFVATAVDDLARRFAREPGKVVTRGSWNNCGAQAEAVVRLAGPLRPLLDARIDDGKGGTAPRRRLWADLFEAATFQLVRDRRFFANQSQIVDTNGHWCNRATHLCDPERGVPLATTLGFVKEAVGLRNWTHGVNPDLTPAGHAPGAQARTLTSKHLSKELGYVGSYGESTIWATANAYEASIDWTTGVGDEALRRLVGEAAEARTFFRYPGATVTGRPVMRLEVYVDWRNAHFPGDPSYISWNSDLRALLYAPSARLYSAFRLMLAQGVFQRQFARELGPDNRRPDWVRLLELPGWIDAVRARRPAVRAELPMSPGAPDCVFADPEIGLVAVKCGDEVLFAALYWRAANGINNLGKIHFVTPKAEFAALVHIEESYLPSGRTFVTPDWVVYGFRPNRFDYPGGYARQLAAGRVLPVADSRDDDTCKGKAEFYRCSYGDYEIAVNATRVGKSYAMKVPEGIWRRLPSGMAVRGGGSLEVAPGEAVVLRR